VHFDVLCYNPTFTFPPVPPSILQSARRIHKTLVRGVHRVLLHTKEMKWLKVGGSPNNKKLIYRRTLTVNK
jgi:hypothetical protein